MHLLFFFQKNDKIYYNISEEKVYQRNARGGASVNSLYSSLVINISLLVLIATFLTKLTFVKQLLSEERTSEMADQIILAFIFGCFCIFPALYFCFGRVMWKFCSVSSCILI